jgi:pyridoxine 5'-phosphate synthase PdxJ
MQSQAVTFNLSTERSLLQAPYFPKPEAVDLAVLCRMLVAGIAVPISVRLREDQRHL